MAIEKDLLERLLDYKYSKPEDLIGENGGCSSSSPKPFLARILTFY
jgi:hypothetical protein